MGKTLGLGYIFTLDMGFPPELNAKNVFAGLESGVISGALFLLIAQTLQNIIPLWLIQKLILFFAFFLAGFSAYRLSPSKNEIGKYFTGLFYVLNPFVFIRFEVGQWLILLGYAITPFLIKQFLSFLESDNKLKDGAKVAFWFFCIGAVSFHIFVIDFIPITFIFLFFIIRKYKEIRSFTLIFKHIGFFSLLIIIITLSNIYWIVLFNNESLLTQINGNDLIAYRSNAFGFSSNLYLALASLHGFWRIPEGYSYITAIWPYWYLLFFTILFLSIFGFFFSLSQEKTGFIVKGLLLSTLIGFFLSLGIDAPGSIGNFIRVLYDNIIVFRGLREPQKFISIVTLTYVYCGGITAGTIAQYFRGFKHRAIYILIVIVLLAIPITYSINMFLGIGGTPILRDFPKTWYQAKSYLNNDNSEYQILFLPWHAYIDFGWSERKIDNIASIFFGRNIIQGKNIEIAGIDTHSTEAEQHYIEYLLENRDAIQNFGNFIAPLNIKYIILAKAVDFSSYNFLYNQSDLKKVMDNSELVIFQNQHELASVYWVSHINYIQIEDLVHAANTQNLMDCLYIIGEETNSYNTENLTHTGWQPISALKKSDIEITINVPQDNGYIILGQPFRDVWRIKDIENLTNLNVTNAFPIQKAGIYNIKNKRFIELIPFYAISFITIIGLLTYVIFTRQ